MHTDFVKTQQIDFKSKLVHRTYRNDSDRREEIKDFDGERKVGVRVMGQSST